MSEHERQTEKEEFQAEQHEEIVDQQKEQERELSEEEISGKLMQYRQDSTPDTTSLSNEYLDQKLERQLIRKYWKGRQSGKKLLRAQYDNPEQDDGEWPLNAEIYYDKGRFHFSLDYQGVSSSDSLYDSPVTGIRSSDNYLSELKKRFRQVYKLKITDSSKQGRERYIFDLLRSIICALTCSPIFSTSLG